MLAGLIPDNQDRQRCVQFVMEGEASLHFCLDAGPPAGCRFLWAARLADSRRHSLRYSMEQVLELVQTLKDVPLQER